MVGPTRSQQVTVDWPRLLGDIAHLLGDPVAEGSEARAPVGSIKLADHLGVSRGAVRNLLDGTEPRYCDGIDYIAAWCRLTGQASNFMPIVRRSFSAAKMR